MRGLSHWAGLCLLWFAATGCNAPRSSFRQAPWVVAVATLQLQEPDSAGCDAVRLTARAGRRALVWQPMAAAQVLEAVSLSEVDAGLILDSNWNSQTPGAEWVAISPCRRGYRLLLSKDATAAQWMDHWASLPTL